MGKTIISVEKVSDPAMLLNALQRSVTIVQVHRKNTWWDYSAVELAQAKLSSVGFQLYMYLEPKNIHAPWSLWPRKVAEATQLDEFTLHGAVLELTKRGYLTPGKIELDGQMYETNVFHFWERPEMCDIDYDDDVA